ncbi:hypothetical protein GALMADRAFT_242276 [Galerina marginata CBS 339.88]|uniref:CUE domain-containing protein n=1 Tax=Galerina marginata (strain CBS 339.88) TaxID=685588 RepID=A0A067TAA3_GALM3|nr:hypothetical protein GALMADRAFT_242276 [Galerina marginata CBS 339.88]
MTTDVLRLPTYPPSHLRKDWAPSQAATLNQNIASALGVVLALPADKRDNPSTRNFLTSYSKDTAVQTLQDLIWKHSSSGNSDTHPKSSDEKAIQKRSLLLAEKLASSPPGLDVQTLLDLSIIYARSQPSHLHRVFESAFQSDPSLSQIISNDLVPGFTTLLSQQTPTSQGLYAQRKVAECIYSFLRGAKGTPDLVRPFSRNKSFLETLAANYDVGMAATASSYGGIPALTAGISAQDRDADEWEQIWVESKVTLLDSFHILLTILLDDLASCPPGPQLAAEAERIFDIIFALLETSSSSSSTLGPNVASTPFLNQSLLADYQQSYSLSQTLAAALKHAQEKDVRLDLLESTLQSLDTTSDDEKPKNAGALKILLRSSGVQPGIDNLGTRNTRSKATVDPVSRNSSTPVPNGKGKSRAPAPPPVPSDPDLDVKATQVLDILPDTPIDYVKLLLAHDRYGRNPEKVIEALLEGTAMSREELEQNMQASTGIDYGGDGSDAYVPENPKPVYNVDQRRNIFDDELDTSRLRVGKKAAGDEVLRDRTFIEEMKAEILRRAEVMSDEEDEADEETAPSGPSAKKGKGKQIEGVGSSASADLGPDDDDDIVSVRMAGDGEDSDDDDDDDGENESEEEVQEVQTPETIVELAYLRDPKVFERDAATRRSKARADLKTQTGWGDEQIEGWKVMLERTPGRKERLTEKYAFRGNEKGLDVRAGDGAGGSRGRGRGGPRGSRGRGGRGGGGGESSARERAWKDKNKASRGNHNRKRGHDKKMARAGAGAGPST